MSTDISGLLSNLALGTVMTIATVLIHFWGLLYLNHLMHRREDHSLLLHHHQLSI